MATAPRSEALSDAKAPWNAPIGVRLAPTMTTGFDSMRCSCIAGGQV